MARVKVRECTDGCGGIMKLANVADGIPLWQCRKCSAEDQSAGTSASGVLSFERDPPEGQDAYTPFGDDDPPQSMPWGAFASEYSEYLS